MSGYDEHIVKLVAKENAKKKRPRKMRFRPALFPKGLERGYVKELKEIVSYLKTQVDTFVIRVLPSVARDLGQGTRMDAGIGDIPEAIRALKESMSRKYTQEELARIARKRGVSLAEYNREATKKEFKRVMGIDLFIDNRELAQTLEMFTIQNVQLIESLIADATSKVETTVLTNFRAGKRWEDTAKEIEALVDPNVGNVSARAKLIARDQTAKLNGQITQERQKNLGINKYRWRTSLDERVRDSHRALEGNEYSWDDPPSVGHPGEDFQCRCTAEPILDEYFD